MNNQNSTERFSDRVHDYVKYRPDYPVEIIGYLEGKWNIQPGNHIADIGSGTGISCKIFLEKGYAVTGIEPNAPMREASLSFLKKFKNFNAVDATAEATSLPDQSIDIITAAQAFHWFDQAAVKKEFRRILKPEGIVVLIWNERLVLTDFEKEFEEIILKYSIDYVKIDHRNIDKASIEFFFCTQRMFLSSFSQLSGI